MLRPRHSEAREGSWHSGEFALALAAAGLGALVVAGVLQHSSLAGSLPALAIVAGAILSILAARPSWHAGVRLARIWRAHRAQAFKETQAELRRELCDQLAFLCASLGRGEQRENLALSRALLTKALAHELGLGVAATERATLKALLFGLEARQLPPPLRELLQVRPSGARGLAYPDADSLADRTGFLVYAAAAYVRETSPGYRYEISFEAAATYAIARQRAGLSAPDERPRWMRALARTTDEPQLEEFKRQVVDALDKLVGEQGPRAFHEQAQRRDIKDELLDLCAGMLARKSARTPLRPVVSEWLAPVLSWGKEDPAARGTPALSLALGIALTAALVPAFVWLAPASSWQPVGLVVALAAIAIVSGLIAGVTAGRTFVLDPTIACALLALVLLGPVPAAAIWVGAELLTWVIERYRGTALFANVASMGCAVFVGSLALLTLPTVWPGVPQRAADYVWVAAVAAVIEAVNHLVHQALLALVRDAERWRVLATRDYLRSLPLFGVVILLATATVFLYTQIGILALAAFAPIALIPQLLVPMLVKEIKLENARQPGLAQVALAMADALGFSERKRLLVHQSLTQEGPARPEPPGRSEQTAITMASYMLRSFFDESLEALRRGEKIDDQHAEQLVSFVAQSIQGARTMDDLRRPEPSLADEPAIERLIGVAGAFCEAIGGGEKPALALANLKAKAGTRYDPFMVAALAQAFERPGVGLRSERAKTLIARLAEARLSPKARRWLMGLVQAS